MKQGLAATALLLLGCAPGHAVETHDDLGNRVSLPRPAQRIVTLAPHATELVLAVGAGSRLVGIAAGGSEPDALSSLPRIGGPGGLDREALLVLQPDLVVAWQSGNRATDLDWITDTGIAVFRTEPASLNDISHALRGIGELSGTRRQAEAAAQAFERALAAPCRHLPVQPVYVTVWERPAMTVGGRHWINAVLKLAGYRNVFDQLNRGVFHVAPEAAEGHAGLPHISLIRSFDLSSNDRLADLLSRPGPRLAEAVQMLCAQRLSATTAGRQSKVQIDSDYRPLPRPPGSPL